MPVDNPGAYSNPKSRHYIPNRSKRKARISRNIAAKGKTPPMGMAPGRKRPGRKYLMEGMPGSQKITGDMRKSARRQAQRRKGRRKGHWTEKDQRTVYDEYRLRPDFRGLGWQKHGTRRS